MIDIRVIDKGVLAALDKLEPRARKRAEQKAVKAGALLLKPRVKAATPVGHHRMSSKTTASPPGDMRRSVSIGAAKHAIDKPGEFIRWKNRKRHFLIAGTAPRYTKTSHAFRGRMAPPDPIPQKVADESGDAALDAALAVLAKELGL